MLSLLLDEMISDDDAGNRTIHYTYDAVGNRLSRSDSNEGLTTYAYDANDRLLSETPLGTPIVVRRRKGAKRLAKMKLG